MSEDEVAALREALVRSIEGRCSNPSCPSRHEGSANDCVLSALAQYERVHVERTAPLDVLERAVDEVLAAFPPQYGGTPRSEALLRLAEARGARSDPEPLRPALPPVDRTLIGGTPENKAWRKAHCPDPEP